MDKMKLEIWSDIACPYCYIGKRKLDRALADFPHAEEIELIWHSYELNPMLPNGNSGKTYYQHLSELRGITEMEAREDFEEVLLLAQQEGLEYNPEHIVFTNTLKALRLAKLASKYNLATEAEEALFHAYFVAGKDVSDTDTLIEIACKVGINESDVMRCLNTPEYSEEVQNDFKYADQVLNLEYIPFYLLNDKHTIQGSVAVEDYLNVLHKAYSDWKENGVSDGKNKEKVVKGKSCSIDGTCSL